MIYMKIKRKCGHKEEIGVAGVSGVLASVPSHLQDACLASVAEQESKLCLPCFVKLPVEEKQRLLKEVIANG